jgi:hypothetical protein
VIGANSIKKQIPSATVSVKMAEQNYRRNNDDVQEEVPVFKNVARQANSICDGV